MSIISDSDRALEQFAAALRYWRGARGLSQAALAQMVHVHRDLIAKIERMRRWPSRDLVSDLDYALSAAGDLLRRWPLVEEQRVRTRLLDAQARIMRRLEALATEQAP